MMNPMCCNPENRTAFERERRADRQKILHPLVCLVSTMRQEPVIAHANPQTPGEPPQENRYKKCLPCEEEKCRDGAHMKQRHEDRCDPVDFVFCGLSFSQVFQLHVQEDPRSSNL